MVGFAWNIVTAVGLSTVTALVHKSTVGDTVKQVCCSGTETCMHIRTNAPVVCYCIPDVSACRHGTVCASLWQLNLLQRGVPCVQ